MVGPVEPRSWHDADGLPLRMPAAIIGHGPAVDVPRDAIEIRVAADGFLPRMVRNIVGALVEVGQGRQSPDWIEEVLAARDRRHGSAVAPAQGLTLWRVGFGDDVLEDW